MSRTGQSETAAADRRVKTGRDIGRALLHFILVAGALLTITPFIWALATSLKAPDKIFSLPPSFIPRPVYWRNYADALTFAPLLRFMLNTLFLAGTITIVRLITCSMAAYAFGRLRFRGRDLLFLLFLGTMMIPEQVTLVPNFILMKQFNFYNSYKALTIPMVVSVFGIFLLRQYFMTLPTELEEAARIDGCSRIGTFIRIILPLSKPALATLAILTFKNTWNWFLWPLIMLNDVKSFPIQVGLSFFKGQAELMNTQWGPLMAGTCLAMIPVILIFLLGQRYFIKSMAVSGLGGR